VQTVVIVLSLLHLELGLFVCLLFFSAGCGLASSFFCVWWKVKVGSFALARKPLVSDESYPSAMPDTQNPNLS